METGLRPLAPFDPLAVPLPKGTEVTTRVARIIPGARPVPEGAVGRVVGADGAMFDIKIVGVGVLRYARSELVPRKVGQMRYAQRRADAWEALRPCTVLEATVGSRAWGLAEEGSDTDLRGAFVLPFPWSAGLGEPPRDLVSEDGSATYWEASKMIRQALRADPNTLELLFVNSARALDPIGEWILAERDAFASAEIYGSFGRYALSQLKRLGQSQRLASHRAVVLEWLREEPAPDLDEVANRLAQVSPRVAPTFEDSVLQAKEYIKQLYRSLYDQGLLPDRDFASMIVFARGKAAEVELPRELRPKNAYNLVRLLGSAIIWLTTGEPALETTGAFRDLLLSIKRGQLSLDETLREAEARTRELEAARQATKLPRHADVGRSDALLRKIHEEAARRWLLQAKGPWGNEAPVVPEIIREGEEDE